VDSTSLAVLVIIFGATFFRSLFGFGEALVSVPLLALYLPVSVATPVAVLLSVSVAAFVVVQDWKKVHLRSAAGLFVATLFGIPLGLLLLTSSHQMTVKVTLALFLIAFSVYGLAVRRLPELKNGGNAVLAICGFLAGVFGGAYGMNGPPLVIYGAMRGWNPQQFRATLQGYFLMASSVGIFSYWLAGLWTPVVTRYYLISLPAMVPAILLGRWANHSLKGHVFLRFAYMVLIFIGSLLLVRTLMAG
jgi:uncharacterized membrane protein YfcA